MYACISYINYLQYIFLDLRSRENFISTISLGELRKGMDRLPASIKKHNLLLWLICLNNDYADHFPDFDI
jgi:hypothetical protein